MIAGTKVIVIGGGPTAKNGNFHSFEIGDHAVSTGRVYEYNPAWSMFRRDDGVKTWLMANHYKVVEAVTGEAPDPTLPSKQVYAVFVGDEVWKSYADRDSAREIKAALGGKAKGVRIFAYTAQKEIR